MSRNDIGPYRVLRLLKRGGGGAVYVAHDRRLNRRVVLKLIEAPESEETRNRLILEARTLARLNHRFIVRIFDVLELKSFIVLVVEYVPGTDLAELMRRRTLDIRCALQLAIDLCSALAAAHRERVVHRDIKAANVLLDRNGRVRLTDFGIALTGSTAGPRAGSIRAMSPEQVRSEPLDHRSDLYALGLLLYSLITGRHPLDTSGDGQTLERVAKEAHVPLERTGAAAPPRLARLVDALLDKNPCTRPGSAVAVRQELVTVLRDMPIGSSISLAEMVDECRREEDGAPVALEFPVDAPAGARCHCFPPRKWGAWARGPRGTRSRTLAILAGAAIPLVFFVGYWFRFDGAVYSVHLDEPEVMSLAGAGEIPSHREFREMLGFAVDRHPRLVAGRLPRADRLSLQVNCNEQVCGLLVRRESGGEITLDYSALLPNAPRGAWQSRISGALVGLFAG